MKVRFLNVSQSPQLARFGHEYCGEDNVNGLMNGCRDGLQVRSSEQSDRDIAEAVARAGGVTVSNLGLRFDRVAMWLLDQLRSVIAARPHQDPTVILALTAPIRSPGKTAVALEREVAGLLQTCEAGAEWSAAINGNRAVLRLAEQTSAHGQRLIGFVHDADVPSALVLNLAERWLRSGG